MNIFSRGAQVKLRTVLIPTIFLFFVIIFLLSFPTQNIFSQPNAELTLREINCKIEKDILYYSEVNEIKINNRKGEEYSKVSIPFSGENKIRNLEVYLKDSQGTIIRKLKKSEIATKSSISSISLYEDDFVIEFILKHNVYPYSIFYSYNQHFGSFLSIVNEVPVLDLDIPTREVRVNVVHPEEYKINIYENKFQKLQTERHDGIIQHSWSSNYEGDLDEELFSAPIYSFLPKLKVLPENIYYDIPGNMKSWESFGSWIDELTHGLSDLPEREKNRIRELLKNENDDLKKMKILYEYTQDRTRYINVSIETGGLKPYPSSYVVENRYGDCKALSNYYKSMLDFIGIPSYYTLIYAGKKIKEVIKEFPSSQFNHAVICVPGINDTTWVDCTSEYPFQYIGTFIQNREAFAINGDSSFFIKTPALKLSQVLNERTAIIDISNLKEASLKISVQFRGKDFELIDYLLESYSENKEKRIVNNYILPDGCEAINFEFLKYSRDDSEINFEMDAVSKTIAKKYGYDILIKILPFSIPDFEKPDNRELPVQINYPIFESDSLVYELGSAEYNLSIPPDLDIKSDFGYYKRTFVKEGSNLVIQKTYMINSGKIELAKYREFYEFVNKIREIERRSTLVINTKTL